MIKIAHVPAGLLAATLCLASVIATAQDSVTLKPELAPTGIAYVTGGVGDAQQQAMKDAMRDYNLRLTFALQKSGAYLAGVKVTIDRVGEGGAASQMLDATSNGPMLFAKLPAGNYRIRAEMDGQVQTREASIGQGQAKDLVVHFPAK